MLIAAQALRLSRVRGGAPSYLMHGLCATNDTCQQKTATPRVEKEKYVP